MPTRLIRLRYDGACASCQSNLPAGTWAWWDGVARKPTCSECHALDVGDDPRAEGSAVDDEIAPPSESSEITTGVAGGSARYEYFRRHERREQRIDQRFGRLAGVVKFLTDDPQSTRAWERGSEGERLLAESLRKRVGDRAILLHDRKVPRTRGNIDHIAVASSEVWVIDAKNYKGKVERRDKGGWRKIDMRLYVGGRDQTKKVDGLGWQVGAVREALDGEDVPITPVLCLTNAAGWSLFAKPFQQGDVWVVWPRKLAEMIGEPGSLTGDEVIRVATRLAERLPTNGGWLGGAMSGTRMRSFL